MKTKTWMGLAGLVASASSVSAATFGVRSVDTSSLGSAITASANIWQSTAPGNTSIGGSSGESIAASSANQNLEYDSYVTIAEVPNHSYEHCPYVPPCDFEPTSQLSAIGNPFVVPNQVHALWFLDPAGTTPIVESIVSPLINQEGLFLGRFSFRNTSGGVPNETLTLGPNGVFIDIRDFGTINVGSPVTDSLLVQFHSFDTDVSQGLDGGDLSVHPTGNTYRLLDVVTEAGPLPNGTARWQVHDLYVVAVPGPSGIGCFAAGAFAMVRGRRVRTRQ